MSRITQASRDFVRTPNSIEAFRHRWVNYLKMGDNAISMYQDSLEDPSDPSSRCCLGHACFVLGADRHSTGASVRYSYPFVDAVKPDDPRHPNYSETRLPDTVAWLLDIRQEGSFKRPISLDEIWDVVGSEIPCEDPSQAGFHRCPRVDSNGFHPDQENPAYACEECKVEYCNLQQLNDGLEFSPSQMGVFIEWLFKENLLLPFFSKENPNDG